MKRLVQEKKEKTDNRRKINCLLPKKKNQEKFHQLWCRTEREKERLLHKYKTSQSILQIVLWQ